MKLRYAVVASAAAGLLLAPVAGAHVEVTPDSVPANSDTELSFHVPVEKNIPTVKLEIQLPAGLDEVTFAPKPGWTRTEKGQVVTWSGGKISPGEFDEFHMIAHFPNTPGKVFVFPALQTYSDGSIVRWIGSETSDTPAPRVTLEAAEGQTTTTAATTTATSDSQDNGRANLALGLAIAALVAGLAALGVGLFRQRSA